MLTMTGVVQNVFLVPSGVTKEGKAFGGDQRVQIQGIMTLRNGEKELKMVTMSTKRPEEFRKLLGKKVQVDVGEFASGGAIQHYLPENGTISALS